MQWSRFGKLVNIYLLLLLIKILLYCFSQQITLINLLLLLTLNLKKNLSAEPKRITNEQILIILFYLISFYQINTDYLILLYIINIQEMY